MSIKNRIKSRALNSALSLRATMKFTKNAVENKDAAAIGRIADGLRSRGLTYDETFEYFRKETGISIAEFDEFLQETEHLEE